MISSPVGKSDYFASQVIPSDATIAASKSENALSMTGNPRLPVVLLTILLTLATLVYIAALRPDSFGFYHDDSVYVTTAKALATGEGYRIISLPYEPAQTKYPPLYPFLLSLIWRMFPSFPENLVPMMMLSVVATVCFLALTWRYLVVGGYAERWIALIVVALAAFNWRTIALATAIYSEMLYAAMSVGGLYLAERYEKEKRGWVAGAILGAVIGLGFMTRSSGLALLAAVGAYLVLRREWRRAIVPVGVGAVFVLGWSVWCHYNRTTFEGVNVAYYTNYLQVFNEVVNDIQAHSNLPWLITILGIIGNNALMLILISPPVVCLGVEYTWIRYFGFAFLFIARGFIRHRSQGWRLLHLYTIFYFAIYIIWPWGSFDRFLIPLLPFLLLFFSIELKALIPLLRKGMASTEGLTGKLSAAFIALILLLTASIILYNYISGAYTILASAPLKKVASPAPEDAEAVEWVIVNTDASDIILCSHDPVYYLYTGRKAARFFPVYITATVPFQNHERSMFEYADLIIRAIDDSKGRYLVLTDSDFDLEGRPDLKHVIFSIVEEHYPERFTPVFASTNGRCTIYRINDPD